MAVGLRLIDKSLEGDPKAQRAFRLLMFFIGMGAAFVFTLMALIGVILHPSDIFGYFPLFLFGGIFVLIIVYYIKIIKGKKLKEVG